MKAQRLPFELVADDGDPVHSSNHSLESPYMCRWEPVGRQGENLTALLYKTFS